MVTLTAVSTSTARAPLVIPGSIVDVAGHRFGSGSLAMIAGPCSVVSLEQTLRVARKLASHDITMLRGGAFKPRTDPSRFQGLGERGLAILGEVKAATGLAIVTELLDVRHLEAVLGVADLVQIGARNMHNAELLKEVGRCGCPVLLKRGLAATIDETLGALDYIRAQGNTRVVLCERGIRTFETAYRFTLDLAAVPILQERAGVPVLVDPSHAPGRRDLVARLSKAAIAVGADGLIVEVDERPEAALSDGPQQLRIEDFGEYIADVSRIAVAEGRELQ
jgi:3-deoxy-7-phosphoheptulonate synthase